jgi:hypothetical protein
MVTLDRVGDAGKAGERRVLDQPAFKPFVVKQNGKGLIRLIELDPIRGTTGRWI